MILGLLLPNKLFKFYHMFNTVLREALDLKKNSQKNSEQIDFIKNGTVHFDYL